MNSGKTLSKYMTPLAAWAFSVGSSVGWGSLVVTSNGYLLEAGPLGSVLGLIIGTVIMLLISRNYAYMIERFPDSGGVYAYSREILGYDFGFLMAWFLAITYFAVLWANATSLPLFARIFFGGIFRFGKLYTLFGYDVYIGEVILSVTALIVIGLICARSKRVAAVLMTVLAIVFTAGIAVCFLGAIAGGGTGSMAPAFTENSSAIAQVVRIAVITPWAFIGFENISHGAEEFTFETGKVRRILRISVVTTLALYVMVTLLSVTAYPEEYGSWFEYISHLGELEGIKALPPFYAANHYFGAAGVYFLMLSLLALVITSLIGNIMALSRLFFALAKDEVLPAKLGTVNAKGNPSKAVFGVVFISCFIPVLGRTAIGWVVDVTTIGATLIYAFVSYCTYKLAKSSEDRTETRTGGLGTILMILFLGYLLLPNIVMQGSMATETYFLFIVWSVLGFVFFRYLLSHDRERRFGRSIIVWIALLSLVLLISLIWMRQSMLQSNDVMISNITQHYEEAGAAGERLLDLQYIRDEMARLNQADTRTMLMAMGMFGFALLIMFTNYSFMSRRTRESELAANTDPMTGVKSKHAYLFREMEINAAIQAGKAVPFSVAVCDVNGLKKINDTYGHKAGDDYIRAASSMICDIFQHSPVFRIGGDEFVVIMSGRDHAFRDDLLLLLHNRSVEHISSGGVVVSGGLSVFDPASDHSFHDVFERADVLMYEEKTLLKGLGSITRDEAPEPKQEAFGSNSIINIRKRILIVEDEMINRAILEQNLKERYDLIFASDGVEAIEQMREHRENLGLVLLDLHMPRMSGREVLRFLKNDEELGGIPVVILTGDQNAEVECLELGAVDFIPKPYPPHEVILARVNRCIELSEDRDIIESTERDAVTTLFTVEYFERYVKIYDQHYADMPMDAVLLDVHRFQLLIEQYGRPFGEKVLRAIGGFIRQYARDIRGVGCRKSQDTFYLYCPHRASYEELMDGVLRAIRESVADAEVRVRIGVCPETDKSLEIAQRFEQARYAADSVKARGFVNAIEVYSGKMHEAALHRDKLLGDFRSSLKEERFLVYYQPKIEVSAKGQTIVGAEALVRWKHPEFGLMSPDTFIPLLEENGLIFDLDSYVWKRTAAHVRGWKDRFGSCVPVSVNVSRADLLNPELKTVFLKILADNALSAEDLVIEITETAYAGGSEQIMEAARALSETGIRIEMDEFGTGYSSLKMLTSLPIDALKVDLGVFGPGGDRRMVELVSNIGSYLKLPVIAVGVETEEQFAMLRELGCTRMQGDYFSKPLPAAEFRPCR